MYTRCQDTSIQIDNFVKNIKNFDKKFGRNEKNTAKDRQTNTKNLERRQEKEAFN